MEFIVIFRRLPNGKEVKNQGKLLLTENREKEVVHPATEMRWVLCWWFNNKRTIFVRGT